MDKAKLIARGQRQDRDTEKVSIGDLGSVVVRGLTRKEVNECKDKDGKPDENAMISKALVDPEMTPDEVAQWLDGAPAGDSVAVSEAVARLSGFADGAQKSRVSRVRK